MQEARFRVWLGERMKYNTVGSRISNCRRVERYEDDLDVHYGVDRLAGLLDRLNSSRPEHKIPIDGNLSKGTATLKNAVRLYRDFRNAGAGTTGPTGARAKRG